MNTIDVTALHKKLEDKESVVLIDVREKWEHEMFNIGGRCMPLNELFDALDEIPKDEAVVIYCEKGIRSMMAVQRLSERHGFTNLINLSGGMYAWRKELAL